MLDVAALLAARGGAPAAWPPSGAFARTPAAEERPEEVGEGILVAEELVHLLFGHRPVAAAGSAHVDGPGVLAALAAEAERRRAGRTVALLLRLFVHPPVRAELVVLAPLLLVAEHFVRFVDLLELRLGALVAGINVRMKLPRELAKGLLDF